ncbi:MAG TPA: rhodanese-like domain-containing protein [Chiayiivirga sp.]|uniref:Rhodanese-like domain-containing protein n=1 Tax=Denitratimonas tolerans TaxID=1338420 RepID=A0AAW9R5I8_9GAMM|nr:rhodanese-like domain-containing protein [Xanthomonadaceae bacterium]MDX9763446.1 rhodanese-like domain-containing protein [Chiayiivirga sp.]MEB2314993.1 rhodanese-like domain-containing protein [Xanthomonadaceae bacterium]HMN34788.1 rhodanese-like domain-containing protein [Chiayiivirga sp.]HRN59164.1 rhodanese-like domain-containing protein [Chiayiivirga sp.]
MLLERLPEFVSAHPILVLGFVAVTLALIANEFSRFTRGYKALTPALLTHLINRENALVVDVSPLNDFEKGHIVGSKNVVMSQFDPENKLLAKAQELPIAVVCRNGMVSGQAAKRLVKAGFKRVHWLDGGIGAWQAADLPLARGR